MLPYISEFVGTALLLLLGTSVVANVNLTKSGMKGGGVVVITVAWGLAVMIPAYIFGAASGAHFNPALTVALAVNGTFDWGMVPGYIVAQMVGGFVGGALTHTLFKDHLDAEENPALKLGVFCTSPSMPNLFRNFLSETIGTFILVFAILGIAQVPNIAGGMDKIFVFGIIVSVGMSLGGLTGYAINPARDFGPRLAHALLPIKGKGSSNFAYGCRVPLIAPFVGGILAVVVYKAIPWTAAAV